MSAPGLIQRALPYEPRPEFGTHRFSKHTVAEFDNRSLAGAKDAVP